MNYDGAFIEKIIVAETIYINIILKLIKDLQKLLRISQINELLKTQDDRNMNLSFSKTIFKDSHHASTVSVD